MKAKISFSRFSILCSAILLVAGTRFPVVGQEVCYHYVYETVYENRPVTVSRWVNETVYETQNVTTYKPVWQKETRERRTTVLKPVRKTSEREERYTVRRPVIQRAWEERRIEETSWETVTEYREEQVVVEKPVVETEYREERVLVRKPITQTVLKRENVTVLKPVTTTETQYVPGVAATKQCVVDPLGGRPELTWMRRGYVYDPATGRYVYQRPGLHWTRRPEVKEQTVLMPTVVPQVVNRTIYVPEVIQRETPIQTTTYQDRIEVRKIPVQVQKTVRETQVRRVPVTVQKPVTKIRVEKVPVEKIVDYRDEVHVRKVPVEEITYERVEQVEPYEVMVCKWVAETRPVQVPRTVCRRVDYQVTQCVPKTVLKRVAIDAFGNVIESVPVASSTATPIASRSAAKTSSSTTPSVIADSPPSLLDDGTATTNDASSTKTYKPAETGTTDGNEPPVIYYGRPIYLDENGKPLEDPSSNSTANRENESNGKSVSETSRRESVLVPETVEKPVRPATETMPVARKPSSDDDRSGDDTVDRTPFTNAQPAEQGGAIPETGSSGTGADATPSLDGPADQNDRPGGDSGNGDDTVDT